MIWLYDFAWPAPIALPAAARIWRSMTGTGGRAYLDADVAPGEGWTALETLRIISGAGAAAIEAGDRGAEAGSAAGSVPFHYSVEADVAPEHEADFNAWYEEEHLPGLAAVPGTIRALRFRRLAGTPRYLACYDLLTPATLERPEWQAVRHTAWSARVRPLFVHPRRTMFARP